MKVIDLTFFCKLQSRFFDSTAAINFTKLWAWLKVFVWLIVFMHLPIFFKLLQEVFDVFCFCFFLCCGLSPPCCILGWYHSSYCLSSNQHQFSTKLTTLSTLFQILEASILLTVSFSWHCGTHLNQSLMMQNTGFHLCCWFRPVSCGLQNQKLTFSLWCYFTKCT